MDPVPVPTHVVQVVPMKTQPGFSMVSGPTFDFPSMKPVQAASRRMLHDGVPLTDRVVITFRGGQRLEGSLDQFLEVWRD